MRDSFRSGSTDWRSKKRRAGRLAWIVWSVAVTAQLLNIFHRVAGSAAIDRIMADFSITAAAAGGVLAMYFYVYAAMQLPSGILADYLGPRKALTFGCLSASIGSVIFGLAPSLLTLYIGRFLVSLGVSIVYVNMLKIQTKWFRSQRFAGMSASAAIIANIGGVLATTPMAVLITLAGWRLPFELIGLLSLIICIVCWLIVRDSPEDLKLPAPDEIEQPENEYTTINQGSGSPAISLGESMRIVLTSKLIWPPFLINVGLTGTFLVLQGAWGITYLMQVYSMSRDYASSFIFFMICGMTVGLVVIPYLSHKLQSRKLPAILCTCAYLALWGALIFWGGGKPPIQAQDPIFIGLGFLIGFSPVNMACSKEVLPSNVSGTALGLSNTGIFLSAAILQIIMGQVLDLGWQGALFEGARIYPLQAYQTGFMLVGIVVLIGVVGALFLKETHCRDIHNQ